MLFRLVTVLALATLASLSISGAKAWPDMKLNYSDTADLEVVFTKVSAFYVNLCSFLNVVSMVSI